MMSSWPDADLREEILELFEQKHMDVPEIAKVLETTPRMVMTALTWNNHYTEEEIASMTQS